MLITAAALIAAVLVAGSLYLSGVLRGAHRDVSAAATPGAVRRSAPRTPAGPGTTAPTASASAPGAALTQNAAARQKIRTTLSTYYQALDARNYRLAWRQFSPTERRSSPYQQFAANESTTTIPTWTLRRLRRGPGGRTYTAYVAFTSHQSPAASPDHRDSCDVWRLDYTMISVSGHWRIGSATPHPGVPEYRPCG